MSKANKEYKELETKYNKLVKSLKHIRDFNGEFVNDGAGSEVSDALHYTAKSLLKDL